MRRLDFRIPTGVRVLLVLVWTALSIRAGTVTIDLYHVFEDPDDGFVLYGRGEYGPQGQHPLVPTRTFIGQSGITSEDIYHSFFVFDLSSLAGQTAVSAKLRLQVVEYWGDDPSERFAINDVQATAGSVLQGRPITTGPLSPSIFQDLGSNFVGTDPYGTGQVSADDFEEVVKDGVRQVSKGKQVIVEIPLSLRAVTDINNTSGLFTFGASLDTVSSVQKQEGILFSLGGENVTHQLILITVPDSGTTAGFLALASLGCVWLGLRRRSRMRPARTL